MISWQRNTTGRPLQWRFVLALLLVLAAGWSETDEARPPCDIRVNVKPESRNLSVDTSVTPTALPTTRKHLQLTPPGMGTSQVQTESRALGARGQARSRAEVAKIEMTVRSFFAALRRDDKVGVHCVTTRSFYLFDGGKRFAGDELLDLVRDMHSRGVQLNWNIGTIDTHLGCNMAWTAWVNSGSAGVSTNLKPVRWLESAVLVKKDGVWKIDFLHSTRVTPPEANSN